MAENMSWYFLLSYLTDLKLDIQKKIQLIIYFILFYNNINQCYIKYFLLKVFI